MHIGIQASCIRQFTAGITICLINFMVGIAASWSSPVQSLLKSNNSPVGPLTDREFSWIGSLPPIGAICGAFFWNEIIHHLGRKKSALLVTATFFVSNLICCFCTSYYQLLLARFLCGIGIVGCMINNGNYLSEISETKYKGMLCSLTVVVAVMGALFVIIQGSFLSYFHINLITTIACGILLVVLLLYIPESPVHLLRKGQEHKSKEILKWLRCTEDEYVLDRELKILKNSFLNTSQSTRKLSVAEVHSNPYYLKVLIISSVIQTGVSLSGISVVMGYAHDIVERMLSDPNAGQYAIFLLLSQSLGCILNIFLCRKVNRKVCLVTAHTLCCLTLLTVGLLLVGRIFELSEELPLADED
ncbi:hypothetical protein M8J76_003180 [Diaphorina citri]|nr:hypothetical protein M8J76_003180 [Diaphorina citri]